jgi:hypothetical protein
LFHVTNGVDSQFPDPLFNFCDSTRIRIRQRQRHMVGGNDIFQASAHLASECRKAIRNGVHLGGAVEEAVRILARAMRETGALPERMVIFVKDALYQGGAGPAQTACDDDDTSRRALVGNLVTIAIEEYYATEGPARSRDASTGHSIPATAQTVPAMT